jgi:hypothetical protein
VEIHHADRGTGAVALLIGGAPARDAGALKGRHWGSIHFDNIEIMAVELLRTPKWPAGFGTIDRAAAERERPSMSSSRCHLRAVLALNPLGIVFMTAGIRRRAVRLLIDSLSMATMGSGPEAKSE